MKAKVAFKNNGTEVNLIMELSEVNPGEYQVDYAELSDSQRRKIESVFGKEGAYDAQIEIIKVYDEDVVLRDNCSNSKMLNTAMIKTYDVEFNDDNDSMSQGFRATLDYCKSWIEYSRNDKSTYFGDFPGGIVSIRCNETGEEVYSEDIR